MSISTEISRLQADRNTIRNKLVAMGMATSTDNLDKLATAIENLVDQGAVSVTVQEGDTYTIPAGYHNGSGTVSGVAGGGNYNLQSKTATPTKQQQNITPDNGYFGLSDVTVAPIPAAYQDVSSVTATAGDVLTGKIYVLANGTVTTGTMANNGAVSQTLSATTVTYTIPKGYHSGSGKVSITLEEKTVTPTKATQTITPTSGKVLSKVTVNPIPDEYITTTDADATADKILTGSTAYVGGEKVTGTMPNKGKVTKTLDTSTTSYTIAKGYHDGTGSVSIKTANKIAVPKAESQEITPASGEVLQSVTVLAVPTEEKSATPTKSTQTITPSADTWLSKVTVDPIPAEYITTTDADAAAANILAGKTAYVKGSKVTGNMANNGATGGSIDGLTKTSVSIPAGYTTGGTVSLTSDIEEALAAI